MNKGMMAGLLAGALGVAAQGHSHEGHKHEGHGSKAAAADAATVTVTGEVIDLSCYMDHEGKGKEHAKCAKMCLLEKHVPAGLLGDDGSVVLLVADHKHEKAFAPIPGWAAERVTVTGKKTSKGGLNAILVTTAEKAK
jgi:hypothetical protein